MPGALLGRRYRVVAPLGRGGMGEVYRADDLKLGVPVALKFLPAADETARSPPEHADAIRRLHEEVRLGREVAHPNVCRIYDIAEVGEEHFLVMEYVDGEDLSSLLHRVGRLPYDRALRVARALCSGLAAAHDKGVLHRDLKPANVLIDGRGQPRLTDFGLALAVADGTAGGGIAGTPAYMSPEQLAGAEVTVRSDLYSLGLVIYEMLTGKRVFEARSLHELRAEHRARGPLSLRTSVPEIEVQVEETLRRCLEEDPATRPASAREVLAALPGGDPLQAALEAGETPSPDMVAASAEVGALPPALAWGGLITVLALGAIQLTRGGSGFPKPPEALVERARDVLTVAGYSGPSRDSAFGFFYDWRYSATRWREWRDRQATTRAGDTGTVFRPGRNQFFYRQSPRPLVAQGVLDGVPWMIGPRSTSAVGRRDPSMSISGMTEVVLDEQGRLVSLLAVPPQVEIPENGPAPVDWRPLFEKAGLDPADFTPSASTWATEVDSDRHEAWVGAPGHRPGVPLRIEAASYHGRPVWFQVQPPWLEPDRTGPVQSWTIPTLRIALWSYLVVALVSLVGSAVLARRNLALGRGDRRGAARIGLFAFGALLGAEALGSDHVWSAFPEYLIVERIVVQSLAWAVWAALTYVALEPFVRRRWPRTLTSWHRLLAGRLGDPMVGRDVLIGAAAGTALLWSGWSGPIPVWEARLGILTHARHLIELFFITPYRSVALALATLLLLLLASVLLRSRAAALVVVGVVFVLPMVGVSSDLWRDVPRAALAAAVVVGGTARFGLLTASAGFLVATTLAVLPPLTAGGTDWYAGRTLAGAFILAAFVVGAFWTSLGARPLIGTRELDR